MAPTLFFSNLKYSDSLTVVGISILTAIVCEAISWLLIYSTSSYKSLKSTIDKASKKLEIMKTPKKLKIMKNPNNGAIAELFSKKSSKTKKIDRVETSLKESSSNFVFPLLN
ncbi:hypothetical protein ACH5RR_002586 [Cinchona calisaya]|uniref:Uncharacterized protein n=1 Tax=Cinchona calisaya TaxID=153742 RepID=A0ABD3ASH9_9GENT